MSSLRHHASLCFAAAAVTLMSVLPVTASVGKAAYPAPTPPGPFAPTWQSIEQNFHMPDWIAQARFGIFIHWGLYAVPAHHNEWYARHMYSNPEIAKWHEEHYGPQDKFGYKDFIPLFKAEKFDPDAWARLFKEAGAKYVIPVAEHHDGFAMYDSSLTRWCAAKMGPKRDLLGDLARSIRKQGMIFGLSSHRMEHHSFMYPALPIKTDLFDPAYADFYGPPVKGDMNGVADAKFQEDWLARCEELVDKYDPQMFWFDNGVNDRAYDSIKLRFAQYYFNTAARRHESVVISGKEQSFLAGRIHDYEKAVRSPKEISSEPWQVEDTMGNSWGYISDMRYRSAASVLTELADVVSKNGSFLLNVSPRADGTIPDEQQEILRTVGRFLSVSGEAIYGSRPWTVFGEGPGTPLRDAPQSWRFTTNPAHPGRVYAIAPVGVSGSEAVIRSLATGTTAVHRVELLGRERTPLAFHQASDGLHVTLPGTAFPDAFTLSIETP